MLKAKDLVTIAEEAAVQAEVYALNTREIYHLLGESHDKAAELTTLAALAADRAYDACHFAKKAYKKKHYAKLLRETLLAVSFCEVAKENMLLLRVVGQ